MISEKQILEKILLPMNVAWEVSSIETDERNEEIFVKLHYSREYVEDNGQCYPVYDHRKERKWRHPDLWQYKTFQHHYPVTKRKDHDYVSILSEESSGIVIDAIEGRSEESDTLHCHDPFHCAGYLNRAVDKCRKREVKQHEDLRKTKYLWLKDRMNLTDT